MAAEGLSCYFTETAPRKHHYINDILYDSQPPSQHHLDFQKRGELPKCRIPPMQFIVFFKAEQSVATKTRIVFLKAYMNAKRNCLMGRFYITANRGTTTATSPI